MKNILLLILLFAAVFAKAQIYQSGKGYHPKKKPDLADSLKVFQKGHSYFHFGVDINGLYLDKQYSLSGIQSFPLAYHWKYEYALTNRIGLAFSSMQFVVQTEPKLYMDSLDLAWKFWGIPNSFLNRYRNYQFSYVPKIQFHSRRGKWLDSYVGFGVGIRGDFETFFNSDINVKKQRGAWFCAELNAGLRARFSDQWLAYAEMGFGPSALTAGLVYHFHR
jgi:hypothetical protein